LVNIKLHPVFGQWLSVAGVYKQFNFYKVRVSSTLTTPDLEGQYISLLTVSHPKADRLGWPYDQLVYTLSVHWCHASNLHRIKQPTGMMSLKTSGPLISLVPNTLPHLSFVFSIYWAIRLL
jgi:hypothetical protein